MKKVLVLMSTYNGERFLEEQLNSILSQVGVDVYLLIRDDGSSDKTVEILDLYRKTYCNCIIDVIKGSNCGFGNSFSCLVKAAYNIYAIKYNFDYYAFADQDDVWLENKLSVAVAKLEKRALSTAVLYASNSTIVDVNLKFKGYFRTTFYPYTKQNALLEGLANGCTMVYNYKALEIYAKNVVDEIKVHDFYLYQICMFLGQVIYDRNSYILYRQHGNNQIGKISKLTKWCGRIKKMFVYNSNIMKQRNIYFFNSVAHLISDSDKNIILKLVNYDRNLKTKILLLRDKDIRYSTFEANVFFALKVIVGIF